MLVQRAEARAGFALSLILLFGGLDLLFGGLDLLWHIGRHLIDLLGRQGPHGADGRRH